MLLVSTSAITLAHEPAGVPAETTMSDPGASFSTSSELRHPRPKRSLARRLRTLAAWAIGIYLVIAVLLFSLQKKIIFPGHQLQGTPSSRIDDPPAGAELVDLTPKGGVRTIGVFGKALDRAGRVVAGDRPLPTILYFYGNGECAKSALEDPFDLFRSMGVNVMLVDYHGYGMSGGEPSEAGCYAAAALAYNYVLTRKDVDSQRLIPAGWSLGGAVAIDLASRRPAAGVIALSSFTSMTALSKRNFPFLPAKLLLRHRFESKAKIAALDCPILLGHGANDPMIPPSMTVELGRAALAARTGAHSAAVHWFFVEGAEHNDLYLLGKDIIDREVRAFLSQALPGGLPN